MMNIARIVDGVVVNLEVADEEWLEENSANYSGVQFVVIPNGVQVRIGSTWTELEGFEKIFLPEMSVPLPGQSWDFGDLTEGQSYDDLATEIEALLVGE
jgi:hypothetical protein